jgi:hypothetical protein
MALPLPLPDEQGRRVILMRNALYSPERVKFVDVIKTNMMIVDVLLLEDDRAFICGTVNVMDHSKNTLAHMTQMSPFIAKKATTLFQVRITVPATGIPFSSRVVMGRIHDNTTTLHRITTHMT